MNQQRQHGFTLIELLLVMLIVGIVMGMGVRMLSGGLSSTSVRSGARQVYSTLSIARQLAISQRIYARVYVTNDVYSGVLTNAYGVWTNSILAPTTWGPAGRWESLPQGISFTTNTPGDYVEFGPTGVATIQYSLGITAMVNTNNFAYITVDPLLGSIAYNEFQ